MWRMLAPSLLLPLGDSQSHCSTDAQMRKFYEVKSHPRNPVLCSAVSLSPTDHRLLPLTSSSAPKDAPERCFPAVLGSQKLIVLVSAGVRISHPPVFVTCLNLGAHLTCPGCWRVTTHGSLNIAPGHIPELDSQLETNSSSNKTPCSQLGFSIPHCGNTTG